MESISTDSKKYGQNWRLKSLYLPGKKQLYKENVSVYPKTNNCDEL